MTFRNEYWFLSSMYPCIIHYNGYTFNNAEAAFQAQKSKEYTDKFCSMNGFDAKHLGRRVPLRPDWNSEKVKIMEEIVRAKFQDPVMRRKLLETGDIHIQEDNTWNDRFWGVCNGTGMNHLGIIIMKIRDEIRRNQ